MKFLISSKSLRKEAADYIAHLKADPLMVVTVKPYKSNRSQNQNRMYWAMLNELSRETGNDSEDLHALFKDKFLQHTIVNVLGTEVEKTPSTTQLTTKEFSEYVERICAFCAQHGYAISIPGDF